MTATSVEVIKEATPTLASTIAATLNDANADHFSEDENQFLKFHGSYQQDDRDLDRGHQGSDADAREHHRRDVERRERRPFFRGRKPVPEVSRLLPAG